MSLLISLQHTVTAKEWVRVDYDTAIKFVIFLVMRRATERRMDRLHHLQQENFTLDARMRNLSGSFRFKCFARLAVAILRAQGAAGCQFITRLVGGASCAPRVPSVV